MASEIAITINGEKRNLLSPTSLKELLTELKLDLPYLAVTVNEEVIPTSERHQKSIQAGDRVEIIRAVAGG